MNQFQLFPPRTKAISGTKKEIGLSGVGAAQLEQTLLWEVTKLTWEADESSSGRALQQIISLQTLKFCTDGSEIQQFKKEESISEHAAAPCCRSGTFCILPSAKWKEQLSGCSTKHLWRHLAVLNGLYSSRGFLEGQKCSTGVRSPWKFSQIQDLGWVVLLNVASSLMSTLIWKYFKKREGRGVGRWVGKTLEVKHQVFTQFWAV